MKWLFTMSWVSELETQEIYGSHQKDRYVHVRRSLGFNYPSPLSATKCVHLEQRTLAKLLCYRLDGLMALLENDQFGKMWFYSHEIETL